MKFEIIPAIDLMDGKAVRLRQGIEGTETIFSETPADVARQFEDQGATRIHLVDLDGAFRGTPKNLQSIIQIRQAVKCKLELGGGLRTAEKISASIEAGIDDAIIGTAAAESPELFAELADNFPHQLIAGIDAKDGVVVTRGWVSKIDGLLATDLAKQAISLGINRIIYTDIARDGMMQGPNLQRLKEIAEIVNIQVIASGGITTPKDLTDIENLKCESITGAIIGRAIYEKTINLKEAIQEHQHAS